MKFAQVYVPKLIFLLFNFSEAFVFFIKDHGFML